MGVFRTIIDKFVLFGCAKRKESDLRMSESAAVTMSDSIRTLLTAEFDFSLSLLNKLSADKSCIVSPFSISLALSLVHSGTKGTAREEIEQLLLKGVANKEFSQHFSNLIGSISREREGVDFQLANRVFVKNDFTLLDSYLSSIRNNYKADAVLLDFADRTESAKAVNSFVSEVTHGKIHQIVSQDIFDEELLLIILVNAVYMNAEWQNKFFYEATKRGPFYVSKKVTRQVDYLSSNRDYQDFYENDKYQLLSLKYKDTRYRFNAFLPKGKFKLSKLLTELTGETIERVLKIQLMENTFLNITLPKFKLESDLRLSSILKSLGVEGIFSPSEELSGIAGTDDLNVNEIIHKATIEVGEEGTVASAVTSDLYYGSHLIVAKPINFIADHPFMFCITFENHPVFIGKYV